MRLPYPTTNRSDTKQVAGTLIGLIIGGLLGTYPFFARQTAEGNFNPALLGFAVGGLFIGAFVGFLLGSKK